MGACACVPVRACASYDTPRTSRIQRRRQEKYAVLGELAAYKRAAKSQAEGADGPGNKPAGVVLPPA
jgi:hypothetical protein